MGATMPPLVAAAVGYLVAGTAVGWAATTALLAIGNVLVSSLVSFAIGSLFKPKSPDLGGLLNQSGGSSLEQEVQKRMQIVRSSVEPKRLIYGNVVVGGLLTFIDSKDLFNFGSKQFAYLVTTIAPHHLGAINEVIWENQDLSDVDKNYYQSETDGTGKLWKDGFELHFLTTNDVTSGLGNGLEVQFKLDGSPYTWMKVWDDPISNTSMRKICLANGMGTSLYMNDRVRSYEHELLDPNVPADLVLAKTQARMMFIYNNGQQNVPTIPQKDITSYNALERTGTGDRDIYFPKWNSSTNVFDTQLVPDHDGGSPDQYKVVKDDDYVTPFWTLVDTNQSEDAPIAIAEVKVSGISNFCVWDWNGSSYDTVCTSYDPTNVQIATTASAAARLSDIEFRVDGGQTYSPDLIAKEALLQSRFYTGNQVAVDGELNGLFPEWTGVGYDYSYAITRWFYDYERLPNGIPNMRFNVSGKPIYNPMTGETSPSNNAALVILDYLKENMGLGLDDSDVDIDKWPDQIRTCDRVINVSASKSFAFHQFFERYYTGSMPEITMVAHDLTDSGIAQITLSDSNIETHVRYNVVDEDHVRLERNISESLLSTGSFIAQERQYTIDGTANAGNRPSDVLDAMLVNIGYGKLIYDNGMFHLKCGTTYRITGTTPNKEIEFNTIDDVTWTAAEDLIEIDESFLAGEVSISPYASRNDLFNAVKGTYAGNRQSEFQVTEFNAVQNATYCEDDNAGTACTINSDYIYKDVQYHYVNQNIKAQRYAKILLEKARQAMTVKLSCNYKAYILDIGDICTLSLEHLGIEDKEFEVMEWGFSAIGGIDLTLQEIASEIYDWNLGDETPGDLAPNTDLQDPSWTLDLEDITVTGAAIFTTEGGLKEKIFVTVDSDSSYQYYSSTTVQYRKFNTQDGNWHTATQGIDGIFTIENVEIGKYVIRAKRNSTISAPTQWIYKEYEAQGAGSLTTVTELPKPIDPVIYFSQVNNHISQMRVSVDFDSSLWSGIPFPEYFVIMYAAEESANELLVQDNDLIVDSVEQLSEGSYPVIADAQNSVRKIKLWNDSDNIDTTINLSGMWWIKVVYASTAESIVVKVDRYDKNYIYLARDILVAPTSGDTVEYWEVAFHDVREDEFKLGCIEDSSNNVEVIKWGNILFNRSSGEFQFTDVTRGAEDTTPIDATGKMFSYFPAFGTGTSIILIPSSEFKLIDSDTYQTNYQFDVQLPDGINWSAMTCMFASNAIKDGFPVIIRSPITLLEYGGEK
jgi:hypothetical protein